MKALYIDDTVDTCDCCGKTDLKKTVAMQLDDGGIVHYGSVCAGRNSGKTASMIKREIIAEHNLNVGRAFNEWRDSWEYRRYAAERQFIQSLEQRNRCGLCGAPTDKQREIMQAAKDAAISKCKEIAAKHKVSTTEIRTL